MQVNNLALNREIKAVLGSALLARELVTAPASFFERVICFTDAVPSTVHSQVNKATHDHRGTKTMQSDKQINSKELVTQSGDRHTIPYQVLGSFLSAIREISEIQAKVSRYRQF
jgi:hypothetical protein